MATLAQGALIFSVSKVSIEVEGIVEKKKISHGMPKDQGSECNIYIHTHTLNKENSHHTT